MTLTMSFPATLKFRSHSGRFNEKAQHYQLIVCGSEKESAAAWLAAALKAPRSPQSRRKNGMMNGMMAVANGLVGNVPLKLTSADLSKPQTVINISNSVHNETPTVVSQADSIKQYKCPAQSALNGTSCVSTNTPVPTTKGASSCVSGDKPKLLQPFKDDRVRRTSSILRPGGALLSPPVTSCPKKKVSFADSMGKQLENIRYFVISPQVTRRYSSYHSPSSYLNNGNYNSPWNMAINQTSRTPLGSNNSLNVNYTVPQAQPMQPNPIKDYDFSQAKLAPRYELVACNFTSPSLQLNFTERLEAQSVLLHSLTTAETTVYGTVSVMNLHFTKRVVVRYTFNEWKSYIEREATYMLGSHDGRTDKFSFVIYARPEDFANNLAATFSVHPSGTYLSNSHDPIQSIHPRVYFALRFTTGDGKEYWDNNDGRNYCLNLTAY